MGLSAAHVRRGFILLVLAYVAISYFLAVQPQLDPDVWWHLKTGQWIAQNGTFPVTDPFSQFGQQREWQAYTWLFDLLLYQANLRFGLMGLVHIKLVLLVAIGFALLGLLIRLCGEFSRAVVLTAATLFILVPLATTRPWLFTILFFVLSLWLLSEVLHHSRAFPCLLLLTPLFVLWANLHIQFVYGLILIGLIFIDQFIRYFLGSEEEEGSSRGVLWLAGLGLASLLATLVNPYGIGVYFTVWKYRSQVSIYRYIEELSRPDFESVASWALLGLVLAAFFVLGRRKKNRLLPLLLLLSGVYLAFQMQRDGWFAAVVASAIVCGFPEHRQREVSRVSWMAAGLFSVLVLIIVWLTPLWKGFSEERLSREVERLYPAKAVEFIEMEQVEGPLYNSFGWGGYIIWKLPRLPVSIDGRTNVHGSERVRRYFQTWNGQGNWSLDPELNSAKLVLAPETEVLTSLLRKDARFRIVYEDNLAVVFLRQAVAE